MILGPKSLAGLIAQPVGPPNPNPIPPTNKDTGKADKAPKSAVAGLRKNIPINTNRQAMI